MSVAGRQIRIFDPLLLLLWTVPLATLSPIFLLQPVFPYQAAKEVHLYAATGFPFAFRALVGPFTGGNIISLGPYLVDLLVAGLVLHLIGVALRTIPSPKVARLALIGVGALAWPSALFVSLLVWSDTWALNWWTLGSPDYHIG